MVVVHTNACKEAINVVDSYFPNKHDTIFLFLDSVENVKEFLQNHPLNENIRIYHVEHNELLPYKIKTLPAILGYYQSMLQLGYYGPIDFERAKMLENAFLHGWRKKRDL